MESIALEDIARRAIDGDRDALDRLVRDLQGHIYGLALRMLWNREDAEDATQEILVRVITRLAQFDFRSKLTTWVYRVAVNYILDVKKSPVERMQLTFERFADDLADGLSSDEPADTERSLLIEEVKIGCTLGMLQCLDRPHRLAYVLGEILDLPGPDAADALGITRALFRKRLQHARTAIVSFTRTYCGLVSDTAVCACHRRVPAALRVRRIPKESVDFAGEASSYQETRLYVRRVEEARWALEVHRTNRPRASSVDFARRLVHALDPKTQGR
jgi:RNA polymerase sigma factor (sigma-70 family)